jgi:hypothetical protein
MSIIPARKIQVKLFIIYFMFYFVGWIKCETSVNEIIKMI